MFFLTIILSLLVFWLLKDRLHLTMTKAIIRLRIIILMLLIFFIINMFFNWGYLKQYSGDKTIGYYLAYGILNVTGYGFLGTLTIYISSIILKIKRKNKI